jgi:hypothetical protein
VAPQQHDATEHEGELEAGREGVDGRGHGERVRRKISERATSG